MSRKIILATHGYFGKALLESCELIMGKQSDVETLSVVVGLGADEIYSFFVEQIIESVRKTEELPLILVDINGGSAYGQAVRTLKDQKVIIVTGLNLPMLIEVLSMRDELGYTELADLAVEIGKFGVSEMTREKLIKKTEE